MFLKFIKIGGEEIENISKRKNCGAYNWNILQLINCKSSMRRLQNCTQVAYKINLRPLFFGFVESDGIFLATEGYG